MSPRPATMQIRPLEDHELENQTISHRPYTHPSCFRGGHHFDGVVRRGPPGGADGDLRQDQPRAAVRVRGKDTAGEPGGPVAGGWTDQHRPPAARSEEHTSELQSRFDLVCRLLL